MKPDNKKHQPANQSAALWPSHTEDFGSSQSSHEAKEKRRRRRRIGILILLLLLLLSLGTCAVLTWGPAEAEDINSAVVLMPGGDVNAEEIKDRESLEAAMQEEADAHYFTLQIFPEAYFSSGTGEGSFSLMNPATNVYPISFEITRDDTGEVLYQSGTILPGQQVKTLSLVKCPPAGSYAATVSVLIFNADTHVKEGETKAKIELIVS